MIKTQIYRFWMVLLFLFFSFNMAWGDLGRVAPKKNPSTRAVVDIINLAGLMQDTQTQLTIVLEKYDIKEKECKQITDASRKATCQDELAALRQKAKMLFKQLNDQALSVEAQIAISKKKLDDKQLDKLDRILSQVKTMRQTSADELKKRTL